MPVRKIPKNYLTVTGSFADRKTVDSHAFESLLEKEYMLLLDFDKSVLHYEVQPVKVPVPGKRQAYTPDILVHFKPDPVTHLARKPKLAEIKTSKHLLLYAEEYRPKFVAAEIFAAERGWEFSKVTELDIRTSRLANLKFLREFRSTHASSDDLTLLLETISNSVGGMSVEHLLQILAPTDENRLHWLPIIWHAVILDLVHANLDTPLNHSSILFSSKGSPK